MLLCYYYVPSVVYYIVYRVGRIWMRGQDGTTRLESEMDRNLHRDEFNSHSRSLSLLNLLISCSKFNKIIKCIYSHGWKEIDHRSTHFKEKLLFLEENAFAFERKMYREVYRRETRRKAVTHRKTDFPCDFQTVSPFCNPELIFISITRWPRSFSRFLFSFQFSFLLFSTFFKV